MSQWKTVLLGEACSFQGGSQPPKSQFQKELKEGYVRLLQIRDFKSDDKAVYVPISKKNKICLENDIMIGRYGASVGQIHRGKSGAYNVALIRSRPDEKIICRDYFYYYLISDLFQKPLMGVADRSAQAGFSKDDIARFKLPYPPLPEQKHIVAILDKAFEGIDTAIANTEKNLANARELFNLYVSKKLNPLNDGWNQTTLGELVTKVEYGTSSKSSASGEMPVLRMGNMQDGKIDWDDLVYSDCPDDNEKYLLKNGDVLFNRTNSAEHVGKTVIYRGEKPAIFAGYLIRIHRKEELLNAEFLNFYLNSPFARKYGKGVMTQSVNQANINGTKLKKYPIAVPSIQEQVQIAHSLNEVKANTLALSNIYQHKLSSLSELKQSILNKAFSGELTTIKDDALRTEEVA